MADRDINIVVRGKDETRGFFSNIRHELESLKRVTGGRSDLKDAFEILKGGGAVIGLRVAAEVMAELAQGAGELALKLSDGEEFTRKTVLELAKGIPFVKQGVEIGEGIGNIVAAIGRANGATDQFVHNWLSADEAIKQTKEAIDELAKARAFFDDSGSLTDLTKRLVRANESGLELQLREQQFKHGQDVERIKELRRRADEAELSGAQTPDKIKALRDEADRIERLADQVDKREKLRIEKESADAFVKVQLDAQDKVLAARAEARELALKEDGQFFDAELDRIKVEADQQVEQIKRKLSDDQKQFPEHAKELEDKALEAIDQVLETAKQKKKSSNVIDLALDEFFDLKNREFVDKPTKPRAAPLITDRGITGVQFDFHKEDLEWSKKTADNTKNIAQDTKKTREAIADLAKAIREGNSKGIPIFP